MAITLTRAKPLPVSIRQELIAVAKEATNRKAAGILPGKKYGAAVLTKGGMVLPGFNIFSPSLVLSLHAEQVALVNAELHDDSHVRAIAIFSDDPSTPSCPCGICLQNLFENARGSGIDIQVIFRGGSRIRSTYLSSLYPLRWPNRPPHHPA